MGIPLEDEPIGNSHQLSDAFWLAEAEMRLAPKRRLVVPCTLVLIVPLLAYALLHLLAYGKTLTLLLRLDNSEPGHSLPSSVLV